MIRTMKIFKTTVYYFLEETRFYGKYFKVYIIILLVSVG